MFLRSYLLNFLFFLCSECLLVSFCRSSFHSLFGNLEQDGWYLFFRVTTHQEKVKTSVVHGVNSHDETFGRLIRVVFFSDITEIREEVRQD